jgi:Lsr2
MAQKTQIILIDDVDGGNADETVSFALDGVSYEIDLNEENAAALREAFGTWLGHARRVGGRSSGRRSGRSTRQAAPTAGASNADIRDWARENGYEVSDRGRISATIQEAYAAAH